MIILNTQGIVLKAVRYKENDVILTLFTRKLGKVSAIAKGAKRNKSSLLSSAQLFSYANYTLKRKGNMYTVNQSDTIKSFYDISYDIEAFSYATYITKLVEGSTCENQTIIDYLYYLPRLYTYIHKKIQIKVYNKGL